MLQKLVEYRKLGGWLRVLQILIIYNIVVSVNGIAYSTVFLATNTFGSTIIKLPMGYYVYSIGMGIFNIAVYIAMLVLLKKRDKRMPQIFVAALVINTVALVIVMIVSLTKSDFIIEFFRQIMSASVSFYSQYESVEVLRFIEVFLVVYLQVVYAISTIISVAWIIFVSMYFKKSQRVRIYFMDEQSWNEEYAAEWQRWQQVQYAQQQYYSQYYAGFPGYASQQGMFYYGAGQPPVQNGFYPPSTQ